MGRVYTSSGEAYDIADANIIGRGQSAIVYKVSPKSAAKIYRDGELTEELRSKLSILIYRAQELKQDTRISSVVLPEQLLLDASTGKVAGILMKLLPDPGPIHHFKWRSHVTDEHSFDQAVADLLFDICSGLAALHERRIYVSDLKSDNILVSKGRAYIVDFDSCSLAPDHLGDNYTDGYLDPRLREDDPQSTGPFEFDAEADWWATAVIAFELFTGVLPWDGRDPQTARGQTLEETYALRSFNYRATYLFQDIKFPIESARPANWTQLRPNLFQFFNRVFSDDPTARVPISDVLAKEGFRQLAIRDHSTVYDPFRLAGLRGVEALLREKDAARKERKQRVQARRKELRDNFVNDLVYAPMRPRAGRPR